MHTQLRTHMHANSCTCMHACTGRTGESESQRERERASESELELERERKRRKRSGMLHVNFLFYDELNQLARECRALRPSAFHAKLRMHAKLLLLQCCDRVHVFC